MSKIKIQGNASGTGVVTLTAPNTNIDRTITLPDGDISLGVGIDDNATSTAITIDASENVGIGTTSPESVVNIKTTKTVALSAAAHFLTLGLTIDDSTAYDTEGGGGGIAFRSPRNSIGTQTVYAAIDGAKEGTASSGYTGALKFYTNNNATGIPTEHLRITSAGNVEVKTGNLVIGTSGKGIDFSADGNAAGMTSEVLDDYEEGTWTPTYVLSTPGTSSFTPDQSVMGTYTKVGDTVHVRFFISTDAFTLGTGSGSLRISGLPFTAAGAGQNVGNSSLGYTGYFNVIANTPQTSKVSASSTYINLYRYNASYGYTTAVASGDVKNATNSNIIYATATYKV
jgi:hypothetical protein